MNSSNPAPSLAFAASISQRLGPCFKVQLSLRMTTAVTQHTYLGRGRHRRRRHSLQRLLHRTQHLPVLPREYLFRLQVSIKQGTMQRECQLLRKGTKISQAHARGGGLLADGPAQAPDTAGPASKCKSASLQQKQNWAAVIPLDPPILEIASRACKSPPGLSRCSGVST